MKQHDRPLHWRFRCRGHQNHLYRAVSWILVFAIMIPLFNTGVTVLAENGICPHHPKHTAECGYKEAVSGASCGHQHDEFCGYKEVGEGTPRSPQHDGTGGCIVSDTETACGHQHDADCGYMEAAEGVPCGFVCKICNTEEAENDRTIISWDWESEDLVWNEGIGQWSLGLPGVNEENQATPEILADFLPDEITAELADGAKEQLSLAWDYGGLPEKGDYEGSYTLTAGLPEGYALGNQAKALTVLLELGGGETYAVTDKFVSGWSYISRGGSDIREEADYRYFMDYYLAVTSDRSELIEKLKTILPDRILCKGYNTNYDLERAGFIPAEGQSGTGQLTGYVRINWNDIEGVVNSAAEIGDNTFLTFEAEPLYNTGYRIRVNSNNGSLPDEANDTAEIGGILNLTVTLHDLHLENHTLSSVNPPNTTVNLFDYWVDTSGAEGDDLLSKTDPHTTASGTMTPDRTGMSDWNRGINEGRLLLFGDGNIHAGFWNKGAGSSSSYGKTAAGMPGIVKSLLEDGYPVVDTEAMEGQIAGYEGISDWILCGDHDGGAGTGYTSINPKNISDTVSGAWRASYNTASLDYLFNPKKEQAYRESYEDVRGLFQLDSNGYYYYDMRQNFAEYDKEKKEFILYDAPAVERTDANYNSSARSVGNFLPFNTGAQVFDLVKDDGKLDGNMNISSNNLTTTAGYMNHHLGMTVNIDFLQPLGGRINTGGGGSNPMTFQFSGDDDVWVFIDDVLVLDLGGIHSEIYGTIDFSTGEIAVGQSWKTNGFPYKSDGTVDLEQLYQTAPPVLRTNLREQFKSVGKEGEARSWNGNTFASNTSHTLKMFYLERGNYDSSLALRFNLQPLLYQQIRKVNQEGEPLSGVEFELHPAVETTKDAAGAIKCLYTDMQVHGGSEFYVKQAEGGSFISLTTGADGSARFLDEDGHFFNFADRGKQYYILKETKTPVGYRKLPIDVVLYYDPDTSMLSVANRWSTGAYACSVANIVGTGRLSYSRYNESTGEVEAVPELSVSQEKQKEGIIAVIPMMQKKSDHTWRALYGSNLRGFDVSEAAAADESWRSAALRAVLEQAADSGGANWYLSWEEETLHLTETLLDLPGLANRYLTNNPDGDMRMVFGIIEPEAVAQMGIDAGSASERYEALGRYVREHGVEETLGIIQNVSLSGTGSNTGFSFLNENQFTKTFRSLIYIPNDQRELWVMKVDQNGKPRNGARFGLYIGEDASGTPIAEGVTGTVNGQEGTLVFSADDNEGPGYAKIPWATYGHTHYYLKELSAPEGCTLNDTIIPVVLGMRSIYADAGTAEDGVTVMAGVGRLTQTMRQYAMNDEVDITLRDITAIGQCQPSANTEVADGSWKDMTLSGTNILRTMNLHYGKNAVLDYGLHDEDGGALYKPYFVTDTGFIRARVKQNYQALTEPIYEGSKIDANKDNLGDTDITNLFGLLNIVVVTDQTSEDTNTGSLSVSKMLSGQNFQESDYTKNFTFTVSLTDSDGEPLAGSYYFYGTDKAGYLSNGMKLPLHHDERITVLGLPAGAEFTVTETEESGWHVLPRTGMISGEIEKDTVFEAEFLNSKEPWPTGSLFIRKTVAGSGDLEREFTFTVDLMNENGVRLDGEYRYTGDKNGSISSGGSVTLAHGQHIVIEDLPAGTSYIVTEKEANQDGYVTSSRGETGTITEADLAAAIFTNYMEAQPGTGSLIIRKTVTGSGDTEKEFTFTVTFTDEDGVSLDGEFPYSGNKEGMLSSGQSIKLSHSQHVMITELPSGTNYTVTEQEADQGGYVTSASGEIGTIAEDEAHMAVFTNNMEAPPDTGSLIIRKTVTGSGDTEKEFTFTVELMDKDGAPLALEFPYTGDKEGRISSGQSITLTHGQHIMIADLPSGTNYTVTEQEADQDDYVTSTSGTEGIVTENVTHAAIFVNDRKEKPGTGSLVIRKTVTGNGDTEKEFTFVVELTDENGVPLDLEFPYMGDKEGVISSGQSIKLSHGQHVMITELPADAKYTVTELEANHEDYATSMSGESGTITENETHTASFVNYRASEPGAGSLVIRKTVVGSSDTAREFTFVVTFTQEDGAPLALEFPYTGDKEGKISSGQSITLSHGQYITITGLPAGARYAVTESEANQGGYATSSRGETGMIAENETHTAEFINSWTFEIPTERNEQQKTFPGMNLKSGKASGSDYKTVADLLETGTNKKMLPSNIPDTGEKSALQDLLYMICLSGFCVLCFICGKRKET